MKLEFDSKWKWLVVAFNGEIYLHSEKPRLRAASFQDFVCEKGEVLCVSHIVSESIRRGLTGSCNQLYRIINGELVKYPELKVDDKVMVRDPRTKLWRKRYFKEFSLNGGIHCFEHGATSWSRNTVVTYWSEWRLPTEEELK